jgi:hypothetical protein
MLQSNYSSVVLISKHYKLLQHHANGNIFWEQNWALNSSNNTTCIYNIFLTGGLFSCFGENQQFIIARK